MAAKSKRQTRFLEVYSAVDNGEIIKQLDIPQSIVKFIAELALFVPLNFVKCSEKMTINKTNDECSTVTMDKLDNNYGAYKLAMTDGEYSTGIHRYEVLVGPTPGSGCRYIGYVSNDVPDRIRMEKGMHAQDYWVGWDGSCKNIYWDYNGTESWGRARSKKVGGWKEGDKILMELNCNKGTLSYTKNNKKIGHIVKGMEGRSWTPAVSLKNNKESVTILWSEHLE